MRSVTSLILGNFTLCFCWSLWNSPTKMDDNIRCTDYILKAAGSRWMEVHSLEPPAGSRVI